MLIYVRGDLLPWHLGRGIVVFGKLSHSFLEQANLSASQVD